MGGVGNTSEVAQDPAGRQDVASVRGPFSVRALVDDGKNPVGIVLGVDHADGTTFEIEVPCKRVVIGADRIVEAWFVVDEIRPARYHAVKAKTVEADRPERER